ncbi:cyclopropane-fatty-acyl-phospholipid synthase [Veronia nyctiphanis]|uniref:Cyclopropane-fatty-acyl-phospholipid synthase n=1 Tax=Veronia nyctiphanis TaxID=1278244 RepID=A0A4Q0YRL8_9GAMM|nr:class I SAM-dependent methyltransferase [Veronia nyctiphanis]RXJ71749.1 cyclopropane-fatty-acyl-phospholipid synthase [Veronia nyctiphanis]
MNHVTEKFGASQEAISHHYDLSNAFYELFLDRHMLYSAALFRHDNESLEEGQINKVDYHIENIALQSPCQVLDIGCGWGTVLSRLSALGHKTTGLTLSKEQQKYVNRMALPHCDVRLENWQDFTPREKFDGIISIGAFEHFAKLEDTQEEKRTAYKHFFTRCRERFLKPNGKLSLQTFAYGNHVDRQQAKQKASTQFLSDEIFRETDPPHLTDIFAASRGEFEIVSFRNDRFDYARTLKFWLRNLKSRRNEAIQLVGEQQYANFVQYLQYSYIGFQTGNLDLYRFEMRAL